MKPSSAALHEAGHCAAAIAHGIPVIEASLDPRGGGTVYPEAPGDLLEKRHHGALAVGYAVIALAGAIADPDACMSDEDRKLLDNAIFLGSWQEDRDALIQGFTRLAADLVHEHRAAIEKIAAALDEKRRLTGADIEILLAQAALEN
jgi:hypothetical protein